MIEWKDITSYSQEDKERIPRVWQCKIGTLEIKVHRILRLDGWYMTSRYLGINDYSLDNDDIEYCKIQALNISKKSMYSKIQEMTDNLKLLD